MVEREEITIDAEMIRLIVSGGTARRGANGEWSLTVLFDGNVPLDDERYLPIRRDVAIKARQSGRKSNPANNWGKGGGFRRKTNDTNMK